MSRETRIAKFPASLVCAAVIVSAVLGGPVAWASGWEAVFGGTDWSPRHWHQTTYFNGSYYLTGGSNGSSTIGGLWQSNDGNYWTPLIGDNEADEGELDVIEGHAAAAFDGKLWMLGGESPLYNDYIKYSNQPDPITQFVPWGAPWGNRKFGQAVAFAGKLWFIGGTNGVSFFNDVWSSSDGLNWTQETASAAWAARAGHSVVTDGSTMYLFGGSDSGSSYNDVWASNDGISWVMVTPAAPWSARSFAGAAYLNGSIYIAGGSLDSITPYNDVWSSTDGATWTQETANAPWSARYGVGLATNGTELLLTGGTSDLYSNYNDTWASTDGATWTQRGTSLAPAPWDDGAPTNPAVVSRSVRFGGDLFLFFRDEIWSTPDGTNWTLQGTNPWGEITGQIIEFNGKLWHLTATSSWSSMDGVNWTAGAAPPWPQTEAFSAAVFQGKLWVFGGYFPGGGPVTTYSNELWSTSDGVNWTLMPAVPPGLGGRANPGFVSYGGRLWIIGGGLQYGPAIDTWFSPDGTTWTKAAQDAGGLYISAPVEVHDGRMWTMRGASLAASTDGRVWNVVTPPATAPVTYTQERYTLSWFNDKLWLLGGFDYWDGTPADEVLAMDTSTLVVANTDMKVENTVAYSGANLGAVTAPGGSRPITPRHLMTLDDTQSPAQITYTVVTAPTTGSLRLNGTPLAVSGTFTQEDINLGRVDYIDDGIASNQVPEVDSFQYTVTDGIDASVGPLTFTIEKIDDVIVVTGEFTDPTFEAVIRAALGKPSGDLLNTDFLGLTTLSYVRFGTHIDGLWWATDLQSLPEAYINAIRDLSVLEGLTNLRTLEIFSSSLRDIGWMSALTNLQTLRLFDNQIVDISALTGLTNLQSLEIWFNGISDISPLAGLTNLQKLWISDNPISDISVLAGLTNLQSLDLGNNNISDISVLAGLSNLQELYLFEMPISDLSPLAGLTNLQELWMWRFPISDLSPLAGLTNLQTLNFRDNNISDISALAGLANLQTLRLRQNNVSDISALAGLTNLGYLDLELNNISDISPLAGLTNLQILVTDSNSSVSDISALAGLVNLQILRFYGNNVSDISALAGLTNLRSLDLTGNAVSDITALVNNAGIGADDWVFLYDNPLSAQALCVDVPTLEGRSVRVYTHSSCNDQDLDGVPDAQESTLGTNPNNPDSDGDGISDGDEVNGTNGYVTNPLLADSDGDGVSDGIEVTTGTDPTLQDQPAGVGLAAESFASSEAAFPGPSGTVIDTITVGAKAGQVILDVNLTMNVTPNDGTLSVRLVSPTGTSVEVITDVGQDGVPFINTKLDDEALTPIAAGTPPYAGTFQPQNALSAFDGETDSGTWTLVVTDDLGSTNWSVDSWSLEFVHEAPATNGVPAAGVLGLGVLAAALAVAGTLTRRRKA